MRSPSFKNAVVAATLLAQYVAAVPMVLDMPLPNLVRVEEPVKREVVELANWSEVRTMPEIKRSYSYENWIDLEDESELASADWYGHTGLVFRGRFRAPDGESTIKLAVQGGPGFACQIWIGGHMKVAYKAPHDEITTELEVSLTGQGVENAADLVLYVDSTEDDHGDAATADRKLRGILDFAIFDKNGNEYSNVCTTTETAILLSTSLTTETSSTTSTSVETTTATATITTTNTITTTIISEAEGGEAGIAGKYYATDSPPSPTMAAGRPTGCPAGCGWPARHIATPSVRWQFAGYRDMAGKVLAGGLFYERKSCVEGGTDLGIDDDRPCAKYLLPLTPYERHTGIYYYEAKLNATAVDFAGSNGLLISIVASSSGKGSGSGNVNVNGNGIDNDEVIRRGMDGDHGVHDHASGSSKPTSSQVERAAEGAAEGSTREWSACVIKIYFNDGLEKRYELRYGETETVSIGRDDIQTSTYGTNNRVSFVVWSDSDCPSVTFIVENVKTST